MYSRLLLCLILFLFVPAIVIAGQINFGVFRLLDKGMTEAEILARAGRPDKEIFFESKEERTIDSVKQLVYIPETDRIDPQLTIISLQKGIVISIERIKIFSRSQKQKGGQIDFGTFIRLHIGMSEGEVMTIAGEPDNEIYIEKETKQFFYIAEPSEGNLPRFTIITLEKGKVIALERIP